jgi:uncharacterized membrane protein YphA (DoxX/SURF4 family)
MSISVTAAAPSALSFAEHGRWTGVVRLLLATTLALLALQITIVYMAWVVAMLTHRELFETSTSIRRFVLSAIPIGAAVTIVLHRRIRNATTLAAIEYYAGRCMRLFLFSVLMVYVYDKFNGMFFTTSIRQLDTPLGRIGGLALTWRFYEYSPLMRAFVIITQLAGGVLILFNRFTNLGALTLTIVFTNIVLIAFGHHVHLELFTSCMLAMSIYLLLLDHRRLASVFIAPQAAGPPPGYLTRRSHPRWIVGEIAYATMFIGALGYREYRITSAYDSSVLPIAGAWTVTALDRRAFTFPVDSQPETVYFETDAEFRMPDASIRSASVTLDTVRGTAEFRGSTVQDERRVLRYHMVRDSALTFMDERAIVVLQLRHRAVPRYVN